MKLKKYLSVTVASIVAATIVGCSNKDNGMTEWSYEDRKNASYIDFDRKTTQDTKDEEDTSTKPILDDKYLTISKKTKRLGVLGSELSFEVENNTNQHVTIYTNATEVNGYTEKAGFYEKILPRSKTVVTMKFSNVKSVSDLRNIKFRMRVNGEDHRMLNEYDVTLS